MQELLEKCVGEIDLMLAAASTVINDGRDPGSDVVVGMEYVLMGINTRLIHLADEVESRTTCSNPEWPRSPSVRITGETTPHDTPDRSAGCVVCIRVAGTAQGRPVLVPSPLHHRWPAGSVAGPSQLGLRVD
jgi:hypothetical protein